MWKFATFFEPAKVSIAEPRFYLKSDDNGAVSGHASSFAKISANLAEKTANRLNFYVRKTLLAKSKTSP